MLKCIIIDDEATSIAVIEHFCSKSELVHVAATFDNAMQGLTYANQQDLDLIFLDIHMPSLSGFDFIEHLTNPPQIILTTSDPKFALEAFQYPCIIDYLVKPLTFSRFLKSLLKASSLQQTNNSNAIFVNIDRRLIKIDIHSIYYIEAKGNYVSIRTENEEFKVHTSFKNMESKLTAPFFFKAHRSYIININKIVDIEDNSILIQNKVIPLSRSNRAKLLSKLNII